VVNVVAVVNVVVVVAFDVVVVEELAVISGEKINHKSFEPTLNKARDFWLISSPGH
jgi:hypothetical protein